MCPKCGARLVTRWHSCGRFTRDALFANAPPDIVALARRYAHTLEALGERLLTSPRIVKTVDYGPNWRGHFVDVRSADDLDEQLQGWLQESHDTVGVQDQN